MDRAQGRGDQAELSSAGRNGRWRVTNAPLSKLAPGGAKPAQAACDTRLQRRARQSGAEGTAQVNPASGIGEVHLFGRKIKNNMEIKLRAKLQAESLLCRADRYFGGSTATGLRCGHFIETANHPRQPLNRRYLLTAVKHRGSQAGLLLDGLRVPAELGSSDFYSAEFTAIPDNVQYRPETKHPWPKIIGTINAFIDAEGSGQYAELNQYGEYKVQLPFDISHKRANRGSAWIRMATPYAGSDHGMHFPLLKGTEVLLSFVNGDPDQPIIMGAVPNSINPSVVTDVNQMQSRIRTAGGNEITLHDEAGKQHILLKTPGGNTWMRMGLGGSNESKARYSYTSKANPGTQQQWQASPEKLSWRNTQQMWQGGELQTNVTRQQQQSPNADDEPKINYTTAWGALPYSTQQQLTLNGFPTPAATDNINFEFYTDGSSIDIATGLWNTEITTGDSYEFTGGNGGFKFQVQRLLIRT
ncbi:type VI secretion system tip protein VgrG [Candidatus Methylospira mobilis]|uniref:Type VI secretion system tip protein VgrG n=1 Tax=Candidatus Methylospira mobilis TaxID=1808979 RepID=A0A5Q0BIJ6_9GAMM|nr:type VI secretion system tip protein VgrG [Candidatus Methylospira mobilis]